MLAKIQTNVDKYFFYFSKISGKIIKNMLKYIFQKISKNNIKNIIFKYNNILKIFFKNITKYIFLNIEKYFKKYNKYFKIY